MQFLPAGDPDGEAPLWVYLHGGGVGYYDESGTYRAVKNQTENTYNHEETFTDLWDDQIVRHTFNTNTNQPIDSTLKRRIEEAMAGLNYREREILRMRFGLADGYSYTLEEVGHIFKVTRERIRQIEAKAVRKLQQPSRSQELVGFLD